MSTLITRAIPLCLAILVAQGCASTPAPRELVDARAAYARAQDSGAVGSAPVKLYEARRALDRAEQAFLDDPTDNETRDVAYVAERRAEIAEASARQAQEESRAMAASQQRDRLRGRAVAELARTRSELHQESAQLNQQRSQLDQERSARQAAENRASEALRSLQQVAYVHEETRGTVITLSGSVLFATGQAILLPIATQRLDEVAAALQAEGPDRTIVVEGHTDSIGSSYRNDELSYRRAASVRDYLVSKGIEQQRVQAIGYGASRPVADNATPEGRANNRRVEIVLSPAAVMGGGGVTSTTTTIMRSYPPVSP